MNLQLPDSIAAFFRVSNAEADPASLASCLAADAIARDEGHTYQGREAIAAWLAEAQRKYDYRVEPLQCAQEGDVLRVSGTCAGNFPGSPVTLDYRFQLAGGLIASLEIR